MTLESLSPKQKNVARLVRAEWIAQTTYQASDEEISAAVVGLYALCGLKKPDVIIADSPLAGFLILLLLKRGDTDSVRDSVRNSVRDSVYAPVRDSVRGSVRDSVRNSVYNSVRNSVYNSVRDSVHASVYNSVRDSVRGSVRNSVYNSVRDSVYAPVRNSVYNSVRDSVRDSLNGVKVPQWLVETDFRKIDCKKIHEIENVEIRREFVRKVGVEKIAIELGAKTIDRRKKYELLSINMGDNRHRPYLKMLNPSIRVWHLEGVHPDCQTVNQALSWRNQTDEEPVVLT